MLFHLLHQPPSEGSPLLLSLDPDAHVTHVLITVKSDDTCPPRCKNKGKKPKEALEASRRLTQQDAPGGGVERWVWWDINPKLETAEGLLQRPTFHVRTRAQLTGTSRNTCSS